MAQELLNPCQLVEYVPFPSNSYHLNLVVLHAQKYSTQAPRDSLKLGLDGSAGELGLSDAPIVSSREAGAPGPLKRKM